MYNLRLFKNSLSHSYWVAQDADIEVELCENLIVKFEKVSFDDIIIDISIITGEHQEFVKSVDLEMMLNDDLLSLIYDLLKTEIKLLKQIKYMKFKAESESIKKLLDSM